MTIETMNAEEILTYQDGDVPVTPAQEKFLRDLLTEFTALSTPETGQAVWRGWGIAQRERRLNKRTASLMIKKMQLANADFRRWQADREDSPATPVSATSSALPRSREDRAAYYAARRANWDSIIPQGSRGIMRFALPSLTGKNDLDFYAVKRSAKTGRYFVNQIAGPQEWPVRQWGRVEAILDAIAEDPHAAGAAYGAHIGKCARCHLPLTDEVSRSYGYGPDCREYLGIG